MVLRSMPRRPKPPPGRYTLRKVSLEIEDQLRIRGRGSQKEAANALGISEQSFSAKQRGVETNWKIEEIGQLADYWKAPPGWPWITWSEAELRAELRTAKAPRH
jgi:hypothetical protein